MTSEDVAAVALSLCSGGVVLGRGGRSVGPLTEAVPGRWSWAVLGLQGQALVLAHDAFEAALWFCRLEAGEFEGVEIPVLLRTDAYEAQRERWESWFFEYRHVPVGDPDYAPPMPVEADYPPLS